MENEEKMNDIEREGNKLLLDRNKTLGENAIAAAKAVDTTKEQRSDAKFKQFITVLRCISRFLRNFVD